MNCNFCLTPKMISGHTAKVVSLSLSPVNDTVISSSLDKTVRVDEKWTILLINQKYFFGVSYLIWFDFWGFLVGIVGLKNLYNSKFDSL